MNLLPDRVAAMHLDLIRATFTHPRQQNAVGSISGLLTELRRCTSAHDYFQLQGQLFGQLLLAQGRVSDLRRMIKRAAAGKPLDEILAAEYEGYTAEPQAAAVLDRIAEPLPPAPRRRVSAEQYSWLQLEEMIARRIEIQLRAVGDAMAWRALGFDRRYIHALCRNERTGPMTSGRSRIPLAEDFIDLSDGTTVPLPDTKAGLDWELGRATYLYETKGTFALLNDLTNILRIGDLTEIDGETIVLHEVKAPNRRQDPDQVKRGQQAIAAVNDGGQLPGAAGTRLRDSAVDVHQHLGRLRQLISKADRDGYSAAVLEPGWAVAVLSLAISDDRRGRRFPGPDRQEAAWLRAREIAHRQARITNSPAVRTLSTDTSGRAPEYAPWGIYPFDPEVCARLICDYLTIESSVSMQAVVAAIRRQGVDAEELSVRQPHSTIDQGIVLVTTPFGQENKLIRDHLQVRGMQITARNLWLPLLEVWTLDTWASALIELFRDPTFVAGEAVIPILQHARTAWS